MPNFRRGIRNANYAVVINKVWDAVGAVLTVKLRRGREPQLDAYLCYVASIGVAGDPGENSRVMMW